MVLDWLAKSALDRLLDPPGGVGGEFAALFRIEALHRLHQADVAFGNQVRDGHAVVGVVLGDFHDQPQIRADHVGTRLGIALLDALRESHLLFCR